MLFIEVILLCTSNACQCVHLQSLYQLNKLCMRERIAGETIAVPCESLSQGISA